MAIFRGTIRSKSLMMDTMVNVIVPYEHFYIAPKAPHDKTVILLHGLKQNADAWNRMSRIEQFAHMTGFNVVIPEVQRSFYTDMPYGLRYFEYVSQELPEMVKTVFNIPTDPDHLYAAGLSMGGFGAMKCALTYPDRFAGAMSYSGALRCMENVSKYPEIFPADEFRAILGMELQCRPENNLMQLAEQAAKSQKKPKLYIACGTEDFLIGENREFCAHVKALGFDAVCEEWPGIHDWAFWDRACGRSLAYMAGLKPEDVNC
ncbi:MAG: esterase [Clostridia bacterium]|nr:esterase [Clostridia bacterium]